MELDYAPHDLLWVTDVADSSTLPAWFSLADLDVRPVVVRRAPFESDRIAVGIRGEQRHERHACYVSSKAVIRQLTPEDIVAQQGWHTQSLRHPLPHWQTLEALCHIMQSANQSWGINGSLAFELATGIPTAHAASDIDLRLRCQRPIERERCQQIAESIERLPQRCDVQIETPYGAFAMNEWLTAKRVMIKSHGGPYLTDTPWQAPQSLRNPL